MTRSSPVGSRRSRVTDRCECFSSWKIFEGWEPGAAWDDFHFDTTHADKVEKVAAVGEKTWQKWIMKLGSFFVRDDVKYFDSSQLAEAERWVRA